MGRRARRPPRSGGRVASGGAQARARGDRRRRAGERARAGHPIERTRQRTVTGRLVRLPQPRSSARSLRGRRPHACPRHRAERRRLLHRPRDPAEGPAVSGARTADDALGEHGCGRHAQNTARRPRSRRVPARGEGARRRRRHPAGLCRNHGRRCARADRAGEDHAGFSRRPRHRLGRGPIVRGCGWLSDGRATRRDQLVTVRAAHGGQSQCARPTDRARRCAGTKSSACCARTSGCDISTSSASRTSRRSTSRSQTDLAEGNRLIRPYFVVARLAGGASAETAAAEVRGYQRRSRAPASRLSRRASYVLSVAAPDRKPARRAAHAARALRRRDGRARGRVRQRQRSAPGAGRRAAARDGHAHRARREPRPPRAPVRRGRADHGGDRRRGRRDRRARCAARDR